MSSSTKCPHCDSTTFELVKSNVVDPVTRNDVSDHFDFVRCGSCKRLISVVDATTSRRVRGIFENFGLKLPEDLNI